MGALLDFLSAIATFIFNQMDSIWVLYTGGSILGVVIVLWILDHFFHIFDVLKR